MKVQPGASRNEVVGIHGDLIRIRLAAPPVDGAANRELVHFLAEQLQVSRSAISLLSGETSRTKLVFVAGIGSEKAYIRLRLSPLSRA